MRENGNDFFARDYRLVTFAIGVVNFLQNFHLFLVRGLSVVFVGDPIDSTARAVHSIIVVALTDVRPIDHDGASIGSLADVQTSKPWVLPIDHILSVRGYETGARGFEKIAIDSSAVKVQCKDISSVLFGPLVGLIDHQTAMRMATTGRVGPATRWAFASFTPVFCTAIPVHMVGDLRK